MFDIHTHSHICIHAYLHSSEWTLAIIIPMQMKCVSLRRQGRFFPVVPIFLKCWSELCGPHSPAPNVPENFPSSKARKSRGEKTASSTPHHRSKRKSAHFAPPTWDLRLQLSPTPSPTVTILFQNSSHIFFRAPSQASKIFEAGWQRKSFLSKYLLKSLHDYFS